MDPDSPRRLTVEAVYVDGCMVELETSFASHHWCARATAYTQFDDLAEFAGRLARFAQTPTGEASFHAGHEDSPTGFLSLRFYFGGRTGHFACHLRLATNEATDHRPEEIWSVAVELTCGAAALDAFVIGLRGIADTQSGRAVLILDEDVKY